MNAGDLLVFYDGKCPFCVSWVKFLLDRDGYDRLHFASLQSEWTAGFFKEHGLPQPDLESVLVWDGDQLVGESEAIAVLAEALPGIWQAGRHLLLLPSGLRHKAYRFVADRRYSWFGQYDDCWVPKPEDRRKFVDLTGPESSAKPRTDAD